MAREIIWSEKAQEDRIQILKYWIKRNQSHTYSQKLFNDFNSVLNIVSHYPKIGKITSRPNSRIIVIHDYWIIYRVQPTMIIVDRIWDVRQNPRKLRY